MDERHLLSVPPRVSQSGSPSGSSHTSARVTGNDEGWIPFDPLENLREGIFGACSVHEISKEYIQQEAFSSTERTHLDVLTGN
jgi:hypothetical protein